MHLARVSARGMQAVTRHAHHHAIPHALPPLTLQLNIRITYPPNFTTNHPYHLSPTGTTSAKIASSWLRCPTPPPHQPPPRVVRRFAPNFMFLPPNFMFLPPLHVFANRRAFARALQPSPLPLAADLRTVQVCCSSLRQQHRSNAAEQRGERLCVRVCVCVCVCVFFFFFLCVCVCVCWCAPLLHLRLSFFLLFFSFDHRPCPSIPPPPSPPQVGGDLPRSRLLNPCSFRFIHLNSFI